ncbi:Uncharacterised protein [BD1-7 clade bacterium]|uniref:STAS/SEC14 domain-containing protein n=1 Tax=BD1-7 clade bacterium TaxID=2029982 RepID=A0A5S9QH21_9GAMM|nr:Uncharacterised protein [BD1-7 clade bacterium]CAA0117347.1 Uncharacterised protein [BD1-7 clade bacterium]
MLNTVVSTEHSVVFLEPETVVDKKEFKAAAKAVNAHVGEGHAVACLMIHVEKFEPWDDFGKLVEEFSLKDNMHEWITNIALVTDNATGDCSTHLQTHFKNAKIQIYSYCEYDKAEAWLHDGANGLFDAESDAANSDMEIEMQAD